MSRKVTLPSGAELEVIPAPFAAAKALYQAALAEITALKMAGNDEFDVNLIKDIFCAGLSSKKIDAALDACLSRCLYNGEKITAATFESVEARQDYIIVQWEVAYDNVHPFLKGLLSKYATQIEKLKTALNSMFTTKTDSSGAASSKQDTPAA